MWAQRQSKGFTRNALEKHEMAADVCVLGCSPGALKPLLHQSADTQNSETKEMPHRIPNRRPDAEQNSRTDPHNGAAALNKKTLQDTATGGRWTEQGGVPLLRTACSRIGGARRTGSLSGCLKHRSLNLSGLRRQGYGASLLARKRSFLRQRRTRKPDRETFKENRFQS